MITFWLHKLHKKHRIDGNIFFAVRICFSFATDAYLMASQVDPVRSELAKLAAC